MIFVPVPAGFEKAGFRNVEVQADTGFWTTHALRLNYQTIRYQTKIGAWVNYLFMPMWFLNQTIAPFLDKLDTNMRDTSSYRVIAVKWWALPRSNAFIQFKLQKPF